MKLKLVLLAMLALPLAVREYQHWATARGRPKGKRVGGTPSVYLWFFAYLILLVLALRTVLTANVSLLVGVGYFIFWAAICLRVLALKELRTFYSTAIVIREGHKVIDTGPYRHLRHPLHLALLCEMTGLLLISSVWYGIPLIVLSFFIHIVRSRNEEKLLEQHLGDAYREYRHETWDIVDIFPFG
ncbi:MAG: isoprenylcysteine carboxylmethyltransferase family protein [Candidatus Poribacteria bacterium]|nr:isoprenylcysteine carboxylmethyltransferase family protein [Candidatus Poribacteria bacterium]